MRVRNFILSGLATLVPLLSFAATGSVKTIPLTVKVQNFSCTEEFSMNLFTDNGAHFFLGGSDSELSNSRISVSSTNSSVLPLINMNFSTSEISLRFMCNGENSQIDFDIFIPLSLIDQTQIFTRFFNDSSVTIISENIVGSPIAVNASGEGVPILLIND
jgi:hypothetical protein